MGLTVTVGALSDLLEHDPEGADILKEQLDLIASEMQLQGLMPHQEPETCEVWSADSIGYGGLHAVREIAGFYWQQSPVPRDALITGQETPMADALMEQIMEDLAATDGAASVPFAHLLLHADTSGFYLPQDFDPPLFPMDFTDDSAEFWPVGSVPRLHAELSAVAQALEVPDDMLHDNDDLIEALQHREQDGALWQAQPIAAYTCVMIREACAVSMSTGAAATFG